MLGTVLLLATVGITIGTVVSILAIAFLAGVDWLNTVLLISPTERIQIASDQNFLTWVTILVPTVGGLIVGLMINYLTKERKPLGPTESIFVAQTRNDNQSIGSGCVSTLAAAISLGCGASVGQYGPLVYLGTLIGLIVNKLKLNIPHLLPICIASGVAAAISVSFNAPIAGIIFAHEVILRHYAVKAFVLTTVAAAIGFIFANVIFQRPPFFQVVFEGVQYGYEFIFFALVGVFSAFLATIYSKGILQCLQFAENSRFPSAIRPMVAGLILGIIAVELPEILGVGTETLRFATIQDAFKLSELAVLLVAKTAVTVLCIGFGFAGGVFSPTLLIGVLFGAMAGGMLDQILAIENSGIIPYAICGMMATASSVVGAPLSMILIVFEMTRSYDLTTAVMVAVVFSNLVSTRLFGRSLFDVRLAEQGLNLQSGRTNGLLGYEHVTSIMHKNILSCLPEQKITNIISTLIKNNQKAAVVFDRVNDRIGVAGLRELKLVAIASNLRLKEFAIMNEVRFDENTTIMEASDLFKSERYDAVPVVCSETREVIGVVFEQDVIQALSDVAIRIQDEENDSI